MIGKTKLKENKNLIKESKVRIDKIFIVRNKSSHKMLKKYFFLLNDMLPYYNKHLKLDKPVKVTFIDDDENANNPLHWKGTNLLGFALVEVRNRILAES